MDRYIKTLTQASNEVWTVFKKSAMSNKNPELAFEQLKGKYKGTDAEDYVSRYTKICEEELPKIKDVGAYIPEALTATSEMWKVFKDNVGKLYAGEMTDGDWNRIIKMSTDIGYKRWDMSIKEYTKSYSALVVWELDRQYRKLHHIKEDWWKYV